MNTPTQRAPRPGDLCTCGRPAATVYVTEDHGDVGYCGIPGAAPLPEQNERDLVVPS